MAQVNPKRKPPPTHRRRDYTEMPVKMSGSKLPIYDAEWIITTLTHTVSPDNGFTTSLDLEVKRDEFEIE